jgi:hypothetical protein
MYYYFFADFPAVIKINGIYYGSIQNAVKPLRFDGIDQTFIEICSLEKYQPPINFIIPSDFLSRPPDGVSVTDLKGGFLIKFLKSFNGGDFNVLSQAKFNNAVVTVFNENGLKVSIETANDFLVEPIRYNAKKADIQSVKICGLDVVAITLESETGCGKNVLLFNINGETKLLFKREVDQVAFNQEFTTTEKIIDIAKHSVTVTWEYNDGQIKEKSRTVKCEKNVDISNLPEKLLPYAFIEELFAGGCVSEFLSDNVSKNADKLCDYFGSFLGVMPPPLFRLENEVGLIYADGNNKYKVEYFIFEIENKKICNIKRST